MPDNYDGGTFYATFLWTNAGGGAGETVTWSISARAFVNDDALDQAWGAAVSVTDTWIAQNDLHVSAESTAITAGGSPAGGCHMVVRVMRDVSGDDLTGDAQLTCSQSGVLAPLVGVIGSLQAVEALKLIGGFGTTLQGRLQLYDAMSGKWREFKLQRDPSCKVCGSGA